MYHARLVLWIVMLACLPLSLAAAPPAEQPRQEPKSAQKRPSGLFHRQKDLRAEPVKRVVALGESTTWGYSVSDKQKCWVNQVVRMLEEFQGSKIELINSGIGSNVITPACPAYKDSAKPSALERLDADLIRYHPDLVFLSYGLNDSRGGTPAETFRKAYQELIDRIRAKINPTIVILNTYYMHEVLYDQCPDWEESSYDVTDVYNTLIKQIAAANGAILADVYAAEVGVDWIVDEDHCHPNDLGHRLIANRVFEAIVRNCSFPARQMPKETLIQEFSKKYGNGPDRRAPPTRTPQATSAEKQVPVEIKLPRPLFIGTPKKFKPSPTLEKYDDTPRPAFYAPPGTPNLAAGKKVTSSDMAPGEGSLDMVTDGDKGGADYVDLGPGKQWVQIDLGASADIYAVLVWHFHKEACVYHDVVVQVSDDPEFAQKVRTIFNNDFDNSLGLGRGKDLEYIEDYRGRLIDAKNEKHQPARARYVRLYSNGNTASDLNHYVEVEVYGKPVPGERSVGGS